MALRLDTFPPDLLDIIFTHVVRSDSGSWIMLGLVSRYFYEVVFPLRHIWVSITSTDRAKCLVKEFEGRRVKVENISLSFKPEAKQSKDDREKTIQIAIRLINLCARNLRTLTLNFATHATIIAQVFRTAFPRLEELCVQGMYPPFPNTPNTAKTFPRLERLDLSGNPNPRLGEIFKLPALRHLHLSGISAKYDEQFHRALNKSLDGLISDYPEGKEESRVLNIWSKVDPYESRSGLLGHPLTRVFVKEVPKRPDIA